MPRSRKRRPREQPMKRKPRSPSPARSPTTLGSPRTPTHRRRCNELTTDESATTHRHAAATTRSTCRCRRSRRSWCSARRSCVMLLVRMSELRPQDRRRSGIALAGSSLALWLAAPWTHLQAGESRRTSSAGDLHRHAGLRRASRSTSAACCCCSPCCSSSSRKLSGIPDREDGPDFYTLVLGGTLGMCLMASANHLLMVFLGVEMASVPSYALGRHAQGPPHSSEAALKYAVYGAGAAGVMLYGISLLAGAARHGPPADDGRAAGRSLTPRAAGRSASRAGDSAG